jgi:predicted MPP superfamily phosphohydrolase
MTWIFVLFCLTDGVLLWALPRLQLSFSPGTGLALGASVFVRLLVLVGLSSAAWLSRWRQQSRTAQAGSGSAIVVFLTVSLGFSLVQMDAYVVEPLLVETTELALGFDDLDPEAPPVRVVHLTDIHIERSSYRETGVIQQVNALQPDLVVLTGDYLNLSYLSDPTSVAHFQDFVAQLQAPYGIYAVRGSVEPTIESMARLVEGTDVVWLEQDAVTVNVRGQLITLVGVACSHRPEVDTARLARAMDAIPADHFTLLLYHSPDLIPEAAGRHVDLYLSGHTHGGQLRLPFYGPIVTGSRYGRRYDAGFFREDATSVYVSRGLGFEGGRMPRARFLCRPEVLSIELSGKERGLH